MTKNKFRGIKRNFMNHGSQCMNYGTRTEPPTVSNEDNVIIVLPYFYAYPSSSKRTAARDLVMLKSAVTNILTEHKLHPYKFSKTCVINSEDSDSRRDLGETTLIRIQEDENSWDERNEISERGHFQPEKSQILRDAQAKFFSKISFNVFCLLYDDQFR
ncbi:hypothetical protein HHI36_019839 [Cryptolaemus montrouzieri]|uniref:Uncharacterized protein n=1 Tax=Cryptolaemus montrouzieri TaxID=559131 RepID=A0ABD2N985_9CUCU